MQFYTVEQIGPKRSLTPEGFLLCEDVPIARTGVQVYGPGETAITPGGDGLVYIDRKEEEVFRPETIASFNGKPVLNDHPPGNAPVDPETWQHLSVGVVLNPRRGKGTEDNYLFADLLINQADAIADILEDDKRQVSCGYGADWVETSVGHGEQRNIIGNHVALVKRARCGSHCSIGDSSQGGWVMFEKLKAKLMAAFKAKDEKGFEQALEEAGARGIGVQLFKDGEVHLHEAERSKYDDEALEKKFEAYDARHAGHDADIEELRQKAGVPPAAKDAEEKEIEGALKEEAPPGTGDRAVMAKDSQYLEDSFSETLAAAEVLVPGIKLAVFDKARNPKETYKDMCAFRRRTLILAGKDSATSAFMQTVRRSRSIEESTIQAMPCSVIGDFFFSVAAMKKADNNVKNRATAGAGATIVERKGNIKSIADINKENRKKFGGN